jgi:hypothetical protein
MTETPDYRKLAESCREYAARCAIPTRAAALIDAAVLYEKRAAEAEAMTAGAAGPIRFVARGQREAYRSV